ncbi:hypothetical protein [Marinobacter daepoensis]|uniref:hypothetical protein n=1 Tax=Marinobacter daepoensis TaxID=262077 RepID=UPI0004130453|nr:hypothetical protein [Marinobacter daepoensis]
MKNNVIEQLSVSRTALMEILIVGFLIGVCASVTGALAYEGLKEHSAWLYIGLVSLLVICIFFLSKKFTRSGKAKISVEGFIIHLKEENQIQRVPRYQFSEEISRFLGSAFNENEALKRQWDKEPLLHIFSQKKGESSEASLKLIREASEYYIIETLSTHLTDYFNQENYDNSELKELSREDVPTILLNNRFMELFSAPMENRSVFDSEDHVGVAGGEVVMSMGPNGAFYSRFDLVLPKGAKVTRENGAIVIDTSKFKLSISIRFNGTGYNTPINFEKYYLGLESFKKYRVFGVEFRAEVEFKLFSSLRKSNWDYHAWLDSYFETIERELSGEYYFRKINWETVTTMIQCGQKMPNKQKQADA